MVVRSSLDNLSVSIIEKIVENLFARQMKKVYRQRTVTLGECILLVLQRDEKLSRTYRRSPHYFNAIWLDRRVTSTRLGKGDLGSQVGAMLGFAYLGKNGRRQTQGVSCEKSRALYMYRTDHDILQLAMIVYTNII
jgi:hypothetical protein